MANVYDLIIIGTGPAGYTASIYASRYKINHIVIGQVSGGLMIESHRICNFPGLPDIKGIELMEKFKKHVGDLGENEINDEVIDVLKKGDNFEVVTRNNGSQFGKAVLIAIGTKHRKLNLPNEKDYIGKGVTYCAACDAPFFKDKVVAVVGGSDSANTAALYLADIATKVYQIYRRDKLRGDPTWIEQVMSNSKIEVLFNKNVKELGGKEKLEFVKLDDDSELKINGLFIEIGSVPNLAITKGLNIKTSEAGHIECDQGQKTSIEGVWAAGDVTSSSNSFKQIITACAEGAVAANDIFQYLSKKK
ncbi:NAD(P)/FAD-dependent oxidoreductase [Patescibacteria group bacterium]